MSFISPILNNNLENRGFSFSLDNNKTRLDAMYENLKKHANDVAPNKAKARIVENDVLTYIGNPIRDNLKDVKNYTKAVKDGKISDNNLGRINDLGIKVGALLIAGFLSTHAKTKTEAIMSFVGGAGFVASMSLWTKAFINLPARLIHGFPIGQKYISAQGDKKDFYLDNQFIVWDAMKEEDKRKYAKRAGIDYDAPGGKEKIERKMQKTALQNRTLNLATVGFGAPLMTSLFCNRIEPLIKKTVVNSQYKKTKENIKDGVGKYLKNLEPEIRNEKEIKELFREYNSRQLDDSFYKQLAGLLEIGDIAEEFKDTDSAEIIKNYSSYYLDEQLKDLQAKKSTVNVEKLEGLIAEKQISIPQTSVGEVLGGATSDSDVENMMKSLIGQETTCGEQIKEIAKEATQPTIIGKKGASYFISALNGDYSIANIKKVASYEEFKEFDINETFLKEAMNKAGIDNSEFIKSVENYNTTVVASLRAKLKGYMELINSIMGSKAESIYTQKFETSMKDLFKKFGFKYKSKDGSISLKALKTGSTDDCIKLLSSYYSDQVKNVDYNSDSYKELVKKFSPTSFDSKVREIADVLQKPENIALISDTSSEYKDLTQAVLGGKETQANLHHLISNFMNIKDIDIEYLDAKSLICLNFEMRVKNGEFEKAIKEIMQEGESFEDYLKEARRLVYDGSSSVRYNHGYIQNLESYNKLIDVIFDKNAYSVESQNVKGFGDIIDGIKNFEGTLTQRFFKTGSRADLVKAQATRLFNDKSWFRIFAPMAIILVATTLLIQPFFGKINKEFGNNKEEGGVK